MSVLTNLRIRGDAKVSDWLGTAALSAACAARACDQSRDCFESSDSSYYIDQALAYARQAVGELEIIRASTSA